MTGEIGLHATPIVAKDVVIVGAAHPRRAPSRSTDERQGLRPRLRRPHRQAALDLPHHPAPGEFGNDTWEKDSWPYTGNTGVWAQMSRRRRARPGLPAGRDADRRLLRRPSARQQSVRREPGRGRSARPASASGTSSSCTTASGTWTSPCAPILADITVERPHDQGGRAADQAGVPLCVRSRDRPAGLADRGAAGPKGDVPGEWYSPTQPFPTKPPAYERQGVVDRRSDRLHAGAARGSGEAGRELQDRPDLHAAGGQQGEGPLAR